MPIIGHYRKSSLNFLLTAIGFADQSIVESRSAPPALDLGTVLLSLGLAFAGACAGLGGDSRPGCGEPRRDDLCESFADALQVAGPATRATGVEYQFATLRQAVIES